MEQEQLNRLESKIDKIQEQQARTNAILAVQHSTLEEHTRRSTMLEEIVLPIQRKVTMFEGGLKILGGIVAVRSVIVGLVDVALRFLHR